MKKGFIEFQKLELFKEDSNSKQIESDLNVLDKIFTSNIQKGEYAKNQFYVHCHEALFGKGEYMGLLYGLRDSDINIYKYSFQRPAEPTEQELKDINKLGRFKAERTSLLYWWAYCFAKVKGLELEKAYDSYLFMDNVFVRCGELTGDSLYRFMVGNKEIYNRLLVFPFMDVKGEELHKTIESIDCYMIEFTKEYLKRLNKKDQDIINNAIMSMPNLIS